ncbi:MAG TPA: hypothetical protein VEB88_01555, partial [Candidatus Acidoferrales bacterium]|nr:hypothetical protein [Candidatus Acidoferrales bacterium]
TYEGRRSYPHRSCSISYQLLGIALIFFVLAKILLVKKLFQINADVHEGPTCTKAQNRVKRNPYDAYSLPSKEFLSRD